MPYLTSEWGNPSSAYKFGAKLKGVVETAREQVAELIGASGREIVFTSCATESNNAAIHAALKANPGKRHIVTSAVEHSSGKVEIDVGQMQADYLSLTGHKFHAPKGVGALYVRRKAPFSPLIHGGHQERNLRGGTECVPLIVGLGKAAELARKQVPGYEKKVRRCALRWRKEF